MEKSFHHKKTGVTFPICLSKRSVHNFSHSVNIAATLNIIMEMLVKRYPCSLAKLKFGMKQYCRWVYMGYLSARLSLMHRSIDYQNIYLYRYFF